MFDWLYCLLGYHPSTVHRIVEILWRDGHREVDVHTCGRCGRITNQAMVPVQL